MTKSTRETVEDYTAQIDDKWKDAYEQVLQCLNEILVKQGDFELTMQSGMPAFVVPKALYPSGYHVTGEPLPFISIAAQKQHIAVYHLGLYADSKLLQWFETEYPKHMTTKLNMGKSCIRFTNPKKIPYDLVQELAAQTTAQDWIRAYENIQTK